MRSSGNKTEKSSFGSGAVVAGITAEKHTPGPWEVVSGDNYEVRSPLIPREYPHHFKDDSTGDFVAYIGNHAADFGEANAHLIAAAPDLLAALVEAINVIERIKPKEYGDGTIIRGRAAIAKARP